MEQVVLVIRTKRFPKDICRSSNVGSKKEKLMVTYSSLARKNMVERIESLLERAKTILIEMGYTNIHLKLFDGTLGWSEHAPYDAIIVTAGTPAIPEPLMDQLAEGGRLVVPIGNRLSQELVKMTKKEGNFFEEDLGGVRFVSLIGEHGWLE
jgi:protein-L-isoaspartate(D-aspartate) O-methyltransferase